MVVAVACTLTLTRRTHTATPRAAGTGTPPAEAAHNRSTHAHAHIDRTQRHTLLAALTSILGTHAANTRTVTNSITNPFRTFSLGELIWPLLKTEIQPRSTSLRLTLGESLTCM